MRFNPLCIIAAVVVAISFPGAAPYSCSAAASIRTTAAIGRLAGLERYVLAAVSTVLVFIVCGYRLSLT